MQWIITLCALLLLLMLALKSRRPLPGFFFDETAEDSLGARLTSAAQQAQPKGRCRMRLHRAVSVTLEKELAFLLSFAKEDRPPAADQLCQNARLVQQEAADALRDQKGIPSLPCTDTKQPRVCLFAHELIRHTTASLDPDGIRRAVQVWQSVQPMTEAELSALPAALRQVLLELLCSLCSQCAADQRAAQAAVKAQQLWQRGRAQRSQSLMRRAGAQIAFWERMLSTDVPEEALADQLAQLGLSPKDVIREAHAHQAVMSQWTGNATASLRALARMPWETLQESLSSAHAILEEDAVYRAMTPVSRIGYRQKIALIARRTRLSEKVVASVLISLCRNADSSSLESHTGYYLLDDGYPALLHQLQALTLPERMRIGIRRHACGLYRLVSWIIFCAGLLLAWRLRLPLWGWLPVAAVWLYGLRQIVLAAFGKKTSPFQPRIQMDHLSADTAALVVCPVVLSSASHAIAAAKHLSILQKANPDPHLHFLLLGEFPGALAHAQSSDAEIIAAASASIDALCEDSGRTFLYLQRERTSSPSASATVAALMRLIGGRPANDRYAFSSQDLAWFGGRYRFVITISEETLLPPGSALQMVGAMLHPLHQRHSHERRTRGVNTMQPRTAPAPHHLQSRLSVLLSDTLRASEQSLDQALFHRGSFTGDGILDPAAISQEEAHRCAYLGDVTLYAPPPQTLEAYLRRLHGEISGDWSLLPQLLSFSDHRQMDVTSRFQMWRKLLNSLIQPVQLLVALYAAVSGRFWLWLAVLMIPQGGLKATLGHLLMLPCTAYTALDAVFRTLWQQFSGRELPPGWSFITRRRPSDRPPMLFFALNMGFAGLFAALVLLPSASLPACWISAAGWALFAFFLPFLEQNRLSRKQPTAYMREVLLRAAKHTLTFFETAITTGDHALPPERVQIDPNKGIAHHTTPEAIGLYLCALISAEKLGLLPAQEMAQRMMDCVHSLEALPKWKGLPFDRYDTRTLRPSPDLFVSSESCGILAVCLFSAAQGVRALLAQLPEAFADLSVRMDALAEQMQLEALYDHEAKLFFSGMHTAEDKPAQTYETLLASSSRLLSFTAVMLGRIPQEHWYALSRAASRRGLISRFGSMSEYMTPLLFQTLTSGTLLHSACREALAKQRRNRLGGAYGTSASDYLSLDADLWYQHRAFGLPSLALEAGVECNVLSPYAALLSFPLDQKRAFANVQRLEVLGLQGPLGFFEAADFSKTRTEGAAMKIVRSHRADHQAVILCAICNALCGGYLVSLFSELPRALAYRLLLEEPPLSARRRNRRPFRIPDENAAPVPFAMRRQAKPLHFPIDAHVLHGENTVWLIDAQGGGYLKHGGAFLTQFHESCHLPSGMRIYLRDSQSGAYWTASDPYLTDAVRFETAQAVFNHTRFDISCEMRLWVNPLDGSAIHCLTLENQSGADRLMEVCSYLEPAFSADGMQSARMNQHGVCAQSHVLPGSLRHLFVSETEPAMFRIQCDRSTFIGRGRSFHAPRALELPISAVADWLGNGQDPCLSLRAQFMLRAGETSVFCFVTHLADETENTSAFCERYGSVEAVVRTYETALTASAVTTRFVSAAPDLQALSSRLTGALAYTGQPWQTCAAEALHAQTLEAFGLDSAAVMLLAECDADTDRNLISRLLKAHAYLHMLGFAFDLVFALRVRTRASAARDVIEEEIALSHSQQWKGQRGGVFLIERADENEFSLLRWAARLNVRADQPLEEQLDALVQSVHARPVYLPRPGAQWKTQLPAAEELLFFNGYGGFTKAEGNYQILLSPGAQTPAFWCNPLCSPSFDSLAGESGLLLTRADGQPVIGWNENPVSAYGDEVFYLRDEDHQLLWSPTRQPLGHGMPVRITHAPGETVYESTAYGIYTRISCASDAKETAGLRLVHIKNEDASSRSLTLLHTCLFPSTARLHSRDGCALGWDPASGRSLALFAMDDARCEPVVMSAGAFQGLWSRSPFVLAAQEEWQQNEGSAAILSFPLTLGAGESVSIVCGVAIAKSAETMEETLQSLRQASASKRLREVRRFWGEQLGAFRFDLPNPALSLLLSRWLPYQAITALLWSGFGQLSNALALVFSQPHTVQQALMKAEPDDLFAQLLVPYAASCCAALSGKTAFLSQRTKSRQTLLERCTALIEKVELGAHNLPVCGVETVWLGMFLCEVIRLLTPFCAQAESQALLAKRSTILEALDKYAWDGAWYLYGWNGDGKPIGRLDLATQCWAVICGASRDRCEIAMENAWRALHDHSADIGRDSTLCIFWAASALHQLGEIERSWQLLNTVLPTLHTSTRQLAARYRAEPYALAETPFSSTQLYGQHGQSWFWDGAGWCWMLVVEQMLGFRKTGDMLRFVPVVPSQWEHVRLTYRFGSATYHLHASRDCTEATSDGKTLKNGTLKLMDDGKIHEAFFPLR